MIVIDASTVISSVLEDENHDTSDVALQFAGREGALIPGNFWTEIVHALARAERRNRLAPLGGDVFLAEIEAMPLEIEFPDAHGALNLARRYHLTGYDAAYLALAVQAKLPLATTDAALESAARAEKCLWKARSS